MIQNHRNPWRDAGWLTVLCLVCFTAGLTTHGLTNWQEARRAVVAREMFTRGEWLVPTYFGEPYIAKPPMIYWVQMAIARGRALLGGTPFEDETEIRLAVALAGLAGVLVTYFAARSMLRARFDPRLGDDAAWLSALGLASGVLYFRSSRIGELDVLTVPFVVAAIALVVRAWRKSGETGRADWPALALATFAATGATMTKGPPALLVIALGAYGSIVILARPREHFKISRGQYRITLAGAAALALVAFIAADRVRFPLDWLGVACFAAIGGFIAIAAAQLTERGTASRIWSALARTHPLIVLGVPLITVWIWTSLVAARVGAEKLAALTAAELDDNLRLLVLDSPAKNLGFMLYGLAPISLAMIAGVIWLIRERPRLTRGQRVPFIWVALGLAAFSMIGKGVARYLTPVWPGVAMIGGLWLAITLRDAERARGHPRWRHATVTLFISTMLAQAWWYGHGRQTHFANRSPREFIRELLPQVNASRLGVWQFDEPAIDFYAVQRAERWEDASALADAIIIGGPYTLIAREGFEEEWRAALTAANIDAERIDVRAPFAWRADGRRIAAWRLTVR